jgi:aryl-alcohol dehydrogenase-like predicted oxidoreductase
MVVKQVHDPTSSNDDYDPKSKDFKLSVLEKSIIAIGSLIVVLIMVIANHPEFYKRSGSDTDILSAVVSAVIHEKVLLIKGWAGVNETRNFAIANEKKSVGSYKYDISGLTLSTIGIGTYEGGQFVEVDDAGVLAIYESVKHGVNVLDTSANQKSEKTVGKALSLLLSSGIICRQSLFLSIKAGNLFNDTQNNTFESRPQSADPQSNDLPAADGANAKYCITPDCLERYLTTSRLNLGVDTIDVFYISNAAETLLDVLERGDFMQMLNASFSYLETQRSQNRIRYYGMSTWNCFTSDRYANVYLSLHDVAALAASVGGANHGFRYIQVPVSVTLPGAVRKQSQRDGDTIIAAAATMNINVVSSRSIGGANPKSLDSAGSTFRACTDTTDYFDVLGESMRVISAKASKKKLKGQASRLSLAAQSLLITRSVPGILTALVGMRTSHHVHENLAVLSLPIIPSSIVTVCIFPKSALVGAGRSASVFKGSDPSLRRKQRKKQFQKGKRHTS